MAKRRLKPKKEKKGFWKRWFPLIMVAVLVSPSLLYGVLNKNSRQIDATLRFEIFGEVSQEELKLNENTTLISLLYRYPIEIENSTIYCIGQLCEEEGHEWTFLLDSQHIDPIEYIVKDKDTIVLIYE